MPRVRPMPRIFTLFLLAPSLGAAPRISAQQSRTSQLRAARSHHALTRPRFGGGVCRAHAQTA